MPKAKAASSPIVGPTVKPGREPQAFAKLDLNFVVDRCLPEKQKHPEKSLP